MWRLLFLIVLIIAVSMFFAYPRKEEFTRAGSYTADMFASNECPRGSSCINQAYMATNKS